MAWVTNILLNTFCYINKRLISKIMHLSIVNLSFAWSKETMLTMSRRINVRNERFYTEVLIGVVSNILKNLSFHRCIYICQRVWVYVTLYECVCARYFIPIFSVSLVNVYCWILLSNTSLGSIVIYLLLLLKEIAHAQTK